MTNPATTSLSLEFANQLRCCQIVIRLAQDQTKKSLNKTVNIRSLAYDARAHRKHMNHEQELR